MIQTVSLPSLRDVFAMSVAANTTIRASSRCAVYYVSASGGNGDLALPFAHTVSMQYSDNHQPQDRRKYQLFCATLAF